MVNKTDTPYTKVGPLPDRFRESAAEHGYNTLWGRIKYSFRFIANFYLNLLAMFMPYSGLRVFLHKLRGVKIGKNVLIGFNVTIDNIYPDLITIEDGASLAGNNLILAHSKPLEYHKHILKSYAGPVVIKKNAWVTVGVIVLAGVTIGEGSIITANSVVNEDIPPNCIDAGNPAKLIKRLEIQE
ncbi:acyltransferase [Candidatus Bathyarchaeota archaeon]|nr:acyltransferase [Candidatus Bathyarchaeota archaeon]